MPNESIYYLIKYETLVDLANAIREKTGKSDPINPSQMAAEIRSIPSGDSENPEQS